MTAQVFDDRVCELGEGPLWHPIREQLFWFDILSKKLLSQVDGKALEWAFDEMVSAAGWVNRSELLIASETVLFRLNVDTGARAHVANLEVDSPETRSNDGRADPQGGFWIGTMGKQAQPKAGSIYRYYRGELRKIFPDITISNSICFAPSGDLAYFSDTDTQQIMKVALDADGWPAGAADVFLDLRDDDLFPDGAVVDAGGNIWVAQWGVGRVACYSPQGAFLAAVAVGGDQSSCPAIGGTELKTLFCTTAATGFATETRQSRPGNGMVFQAEISHKGQYEHQVILG
jgi:sugar lactone lactonase YvrE